MATRVELPKELLLSALEQAAALRSRNIKASTNLVIKQALEEELRVITLAKNTMQETK